MILLVRRQGKIICFFRLESYKQILICREVWERAFLEEDI